MRTSVVVRHDAWGPIVSQCPLLDQARLREERQGVDWSVSASGRTLEAVVPGAIAAARERLAVFTDNRRELSGLNDRRLLAELNVVAGDGLLTRAGEILFCGSRRGSGPRVIYQYRSTPGGEPTAIERLTGPLILEFERVLEFIRARRHLTPITLPDGQQIHVEDFPDLQRYAKGSRERRDPSRLPSCPTCVHRPFSRGLRRSISGAVGLGCHAGEHPDSSFEATKPIPRSRCADPRVRGGDRARRGPYVPRDDPLG